MDKTSSRLPRLVALATAVACLCCLSTPVGAGPVVLQDNKAPSDAVVDTSKLVSMEPTPLEADDVPSWDRPATTPANKSSAPAKPGDHALAAVNAAMPGRSAVPAASAAHSAEPSLGKEIHDNIKETVRPVYDQLVESGAVEAWHDVKEGLGLNKGQWKEQDKADGQPKAPGQWDTPDAALPPRTAAQAQMDRELAGMMREKLIDQLTPWVIGLVCLYVLGYLIKLIYGYVRWKSARRTERRIQQAKRHAARRSTNTRPAPLAASTRPAPLAASAKSEPKERA